MFKKILGDIPPPRTKGGSTIYKTIRQFPKQFLDSWNIVEKLDLSRLKRRQFRQVLYAGMGGSSLPADLLNDTLEGKLRLRVAREYRLPPETTDEDLLLCVSYSGNTEETIESLADGLNRGCQIVVMSHGGKLKEIASKKNLFFIPIPQCIQPRCATGYFFASTLALLHRLDLLESKKSLLEELTTFLEKGQDKYETEGKIIASQLIDRVPIIYGPESLHGVCRIWKIKFNENAKIQSFYNVFPELNHNEMVGYTRLIMNPTLLYLKSQFMHPKISKRMEVMKNILSEKKIPILEVDLTGKNLLQETFTSLAIGDYASYYLAINYGIDPAPVEMVEDFKKKLG